MGCGGGYQIREATVVSSQERLMRCFCVLKVVSQQHKKLARSLHFCTSRVEACGTMASAPMKTDFHETLADLLAVILDH